MSGLFRYAVFDDAGRCTGIMTSPVDLGLPHRVDADARPEGVYRTKAGSVRRRRAVQIVAARAFLIADGVDRIAIAGVPASGMLTVNGRACGGKYVTAAAPGTLVVALAGAHRCDPVLIEADTLAAFAERFAADVDSAAAAARLAHGGADAEQQDIHRRKEAEARAWLAAPRPANCPFLDAEAAERGKDIEALAIEIIAKADAWAAVSAAIEAKRVAAKKIIAAATDVETMIAATDIEWPTTADSKGE